MVCIYSCNIAILSLIWALANNNTPYIYTVCYGIYGQSLINTLLNSFILTGLPVKAGGVQSEDQ